MKEEILGEMLGNVCVVIIAYYVVDEVSVWEISWQVILGSVGWRAVSKWMHFRLSEK